MSGPVLPTEAGRARYVRDTLEFGRVVNLSDGLFAISLTLLVFTSTPPPCPSAASTGS